MINLFCIADFLPEDGSVHRQGDSDQQDLYAREVLHGQQEDRHHRREQQDLRNRLLQRQAEDHLREHHVLAHRTIILYLMRPRCLIINIKILIIE